MIISTLLYLKSSIAIVILKKFQKLRPPLQFTTYLSIVIICQETWFSFNGWHFVPLSVKVVENNNLVNYAWRKKYEKIAHHQANKIFYSLHFCYFPPNPDPPVSFLLLVIVIKSERETDATCKKKRLKYYNTFINFL